MVNIRNLLFTLLPIVIDRPPAIFVLPTAAQATVSDDSANNINVLHGIHEYGYHTKLRPSPQIGGQRITEDWLHSLPEHDCKWRFRYVLTSCVILIAPMLFLRMTAQEIFEMVEALEIPDEIVTRSKCVFTGVEALAITCARFRTAGDQHELAMMYCRARSSISEIVNWMVKYIDLTWSHLLDFDHTLLLSPANLQIYSDAVYSSGAPLTGIWGFIDCTIRRICRPSQWQRQAYSGHKRFHALKFQAIMLPNGIFSHLFGPFKGC
jgi:hypothetical protein